MSERAPQVFKQLLVRRGCPTQLIFTSSLFHDRSLVGSVKRRSWSRQTCPAEATSLAAGLQSRHWDAIATRFH